MQVSSDMLAPFLTHTQRRVGNTTYEETKYLLHAVAQTMLKLSIFNNGYNLSARPTHTDTYIRPHECTYVKPHIIYLFI